MPWEISKHPKKIFNKFISKIIGNAELQIGSFTRLDNKLDKNGPKIKACDSTNSDSGSNNIIKILITVIAITIEPHIIARIIESNK